MDREVDPTGSFWVDHPDSYPVDDWSAVGKVGDFKVVNGVTKVHVPGVGWQDVPPDFFDKAAEEGDRDLTPEERRSLSDLKMKQVRALWRANISNGMKQSDAVDSALSYASALGVEYLDSDGKEVQAARRFAAQQGVRSDPVAEILGLTSSDQDWELTNSLDHVNTLMADVDADARFLGFNEPWYVLKMDPERTQRLWTEVAALSKRLETVVGEIFEVFQKASTSLLEQLSDIMTFQKVESINAINARLGGLRSSLGSSQELRHGSSAVCPRHGPTKGGLCRRCQR